MDATGWDARYDASDLVWGADANRWMVAEADQLRPGRALDLACGEGRNALWLAHRGWQVTGVDFSSVALARAAQLALQAGLADQLTWVQADVHDTGSWGGPFDLVVVAYLHLPAAERREVLRATTDVMAVGGTLLVIAHDLTNLAEGVGGPQDPTVLFTPQDVVADLAGIPQVVVERAERVYRPVATPEGERNAIDALVRVHRS